MTTEDITRVLTTIIGNLMFQRAAGLSTNGDQSSTIQGERLYGNLYPTRPSFNLGRGRMIQKGNMGPNSETSQRGSRKGFKDKNATSQSERHHPQRTQYEYTPETTEEEAEFQRWSQAKRARHQTGSNGGRDLMNLTVEASTDDRPSRVVYARQREPTNTGVRYQERFRPKPSAPSLEVMQHRRSSRERESAIIPNWDVRDGSDDEYGGNPAPVSGEGGV